MPKICHVEILSKNYCILFVYNLYNEVVCDSICLSVPSYPRQFRMYGAEIL